MGNVTDNSWRDCKHREQSLIDFLALRYIKAIAMSSKPNALYTSISESFTSQNECI